MALAVNQIPYNTPTANLRRPTPTHFFTNHPSWSSLPSRTLHIVSASKKTSRTRKFEKRSGSTSTKDGEDGLGGLQSAGSEETYEGYFLPELPGEEPDFWEGPEWDGLGFFMQYMWAFGILFAIVSGGIAVATYNEGATDFKETPAYKESSQSRDLLEEPEESNSDVFESNPTEDAPSLE